MTFVLIILIVFGILTGIFGFLWYTKTYLPHRSSSEARTADLALDARIKNDANNVNNAIGAFYLGHGTYPVTLNELVSAGYLLGKPTIDIQPIALDQFDYTTEASQSGYSLKAKTKLSTGQEVIYSASKTAVPTTRPKPSYFKSQEACQSETKSFCQCMLTNVETEACSGWAAR